jgi:hypothetical protein
MLIVSGIVFAVALAIGSGDVVPVGNMIGGVAGLVAAAAGTVFFGLAEDF